MMEKRINDEEIIIALLRVDVLTFPYWIYVQNSEGELVRPRAADFVATL